MEISAIRVVFPKAKAARLESGYTLLTFERFLAENGRLFKVVFGATIAGALPFGPVSLLDLFYPEGISF